MTHESIARHGNLRASPRKGVFRTSMVLVLASKGRKPTVIEFFCTYTYYLFSSHFAHQINRLLCQEVMIIGPDKYAHSPQHAQTQHTAHEHMHTIFWLFTLQLHNHSVSSRSIYTMYISVPVSHLLGSVFLKCIPCRYTLAEFFNT